MVQKYWRRFVFAGVLGSISGVLALTPLGLIPVPNLSTYATTMHIPAIIGGIMGGPLVGALVGCILAFFTMHLFLGNILACFLPRIFIGIVAFFLWKIFGKSTLGVVIGSLGGTLTNTVGVLSLMVLMKYFTWQQVIPIFLLNGVLELIIAGLVVLPIVKLLSKVVRIE
ncbi:MAG: ECF transporter S component [Candidatus Caldatribacteriaceae bacterium]